MENNNKINNLRKEALDILATANKNIDDGLLSNACVDLKKVVSKAEEIFHLSNLESDKEFLLDSYMKLGKYYSKIYQLTLERKDILPACIYFEKIIYFYEDDLTKKTKDVIPLLNKLMEAYIQLLWVTLEIKDYTIFKKFINKAYKHSLRLSRKSRAYEDEQYYILVNIFYGDYYKDINKIKRANCYYLLAANKLNRIYNKMPSEGIKNDLMLVYSSLSEIAKMMKKTKMKIKYDNLINQLNK